MCHHEDCTRRASGCFGDQVLRVDLAEPGDFGTEGLRVDRQPVRVELVPEPLRRRERPRLTEGVVIREALSECLGLRAVEGRQERTRERRRSRDAEGSQQERQPY